MDDTRLSRSGTSDAGKLTHRVDVLLTEEQADAVTAVAAIAQIPKSEYVRRVLVAHAFGQLHMLRSLSRAEPLGQGEESR